MTYNTTQRKRLAIVWSVLILRPSLQEKRSTIRNDHDSAKWILNLANSSDWLVQWRVCHFKYDFWVVHGAGIKNQTANALSCVQTIADDQTYSDNDLPILAIEKQNSDKNDVYVATVQRNEEISLQAT